MATATANEILLYGAFGEEIIARNFSHQLADLKDADEIDIRINSAGGEVFEGLAIYDAIIRARQRGQRVNTYNDGACFSMAAIIFQAGGTRIMADHALLMIHLPHVATGGNANQLRKDIETLDKVTTQLAGILSSRSKQPDATVRKWLDAESWFDAQEAVAFGLADKRYTDANAHSALANKIFAKYRVPARYTAARRGPIEERVASLETTARTARRTNSYAVFRHLGNEAAYEAERIVKLPGATTDDLARVANALQSIRETDDWPRDIYR